jgi:4-amino-4-deoxy-L-arabinose transferase-like glycosyltransferase
VAAWAAFALPFATYVYSMQRNVGFWDVGEMQTVPYILGIAHPTGFPAFVLTGWLFTHAFPFGEVAWRMTLLCACAMSVTAWVVYRMLADELKDPAIAFLAALSFAFTDLAWVHGTRTEVHAFSIALIALTFWCALRWSATLEKRWLYAGAVAWGLALATHPIAVLVGIGLLMLVVSRWESLSVAQVVKAGALCALIVCALYAYLPLRSAQVYAQRRDPTLALGVGPGRPFWDYDHPAQRDGFVALVTGSDFEVGSGLAAIFLPKTYLEHGARYVRSIVGNFTLVGALAILAGAVLFVRSDRLRALGLIVAATASVPFGLGYPPEADVDRYFLPSFVVGAVLIGVALRSTVRRWPRLRAAVLAVAVAIVALQFYLHRDLLEQRYDPGATRYLAFVRSHTPPQAILLAPWLYATPLAYAAYVQHDLGDRIVEAAWLGDDAALVPAWVKTRPVYVVYLAWGDLPAGYHVVRVRGSDPPLYRVVRKRP